MKDPYFAKISLVLAHLLGGKMLLAEPRELLGVSMFWELLIISDISICELILVVSPIFAADYHLLYLNLSGRVTERFCITPIFSGIWDYCNVR